jgi:hypothetical protein
MKSYLCWFAHGKSYIPRETMIKRMVGLTFSSSDIHEVVNDSNKPYMNMVMYAMMMNQSYVSQYLLIVDKQLNANPIMFFIF